MPSILFSGRPCLDVPAAAKSVTDRGGLLPPDFARANTFANPLGESPGRGWVLMLRRDLDAIDLDGLHTLVMDDLAGGKITLRNLVFVQARTLLPGKPGDKDAAFLVEIADSRWRCHNPYYSIPVSNDQYNVRAQGWGGGSTAAAFYTGSLSGGTTLWTWQTMVTQLWSLLTTQLGSSSTLPFTPHGTPEGWKFVGMSAWQALCLVLARLGCAVRMDLAAISGQASIVRVGSTDTAFDTLTSTLSRAGRLIGDAEFVESYRGREPYGVRVFFHRANTHAGTEESTNRASGQWSTSPVSTVDVVGPNATYCEANSYHPIWDDLPALLDDDGTTIANSSDLSDRASERKTDFYRMIHSTGGGRIHRHYAGVQLFAPGSGCKGVAWRQDAQGGLVTEVVRHPWRMLEVDNVGGWGERDWADNTKLHVPDLRPTLPTWPNVGPPILRIATAAITANGFDCYVQRSDGVGGFADAEQVYAADLAGATSITLNRRLFGRLIGYANSRPLWEIDSSTASAGGGSTVEIVAVTSSTAAATVGAYDHYSCNTLTFDGTTYTASVAARVTFPNNERPAVASYSALATGLTSGGVPLYIGLYLPLQVQATDAGTGDSDATVYGITHLHFNQGSGLAVSYPATYKVKVAAADASKTHSGVVNLTADQVLGDGAKLFSDKLTVNQDQGTGVMFHVRKNTGSTPALEVTADGTARINTTATTFTLEISGTLQATGNITSGATVTGNALVATTTCTAATVNATTKYQANGIDGTSTDYVDGITTTIDFTNGIATSVT